MAFYNNLRLFFLLYSLLLPLNLAQDDISPSPDSDFIADYDYESSPPAESVSSPSLPHAPVPSPRAGMARSPSPSLGHAPSPSLSSGPTTSPSPSSGHAPSPSLSSGPAAGVSPSLGPASGSSLSSGPAASPSPSSRLAPSPTSHSKLGTSSPSPGPSTNDLGDFDGLLQFDFSPTPAPSIVVDSKVKKLCDDTDHPDLCLTTIAPLLNGKTDVVSVLDIALKAGAELSRYGLSLAQKLDAKPQTSPELASIINNCKNSYSTAVDNYESSIDSIPEKDIGTIRSKLSAVITFVGDCDDALSKQDMDSPLSVISPRLRNMTSNCLAIASNLG